jgi:hypothetical protein
MKKNFIKPLEKGKKIIINTFNNLQRTLKLDKTHTKRALKQRENY